MNRRAAFHKLEASALLPLLTVEFEEVDPHENESLLSRATRGALGARKIPKLLGIAQSSIHVALDAEDDVRGTAMPQVALSSWWL